MEENQPKKPVWLKLYSVVLIANAIYFILFYLITKAF
ncbi:hypothetical protein SAMN04489722_101612 [Algibacter lectus]|jgi:hypothetical protein|uniref:Uncharacterized protein n=1 Tax=Algibacter lectus TaxID=221126 RepID=A0A4R8MET2_9FLAO|nr:hypothetical protein DFQ06_1319 [Algibacter lectus]SFC09073.1 hypothetical protein SAMN04489722_101612 [Algibacter lectus]